MTLTSRTLFAPVLVLVVAVPTQHVAADEPAEAASERAASLARLTKVIESYTITMGEDRAEQLELVKAPVLRYSDPITSITDGLVFVWTKAGRPEAAMAIHPGSLGRTWLEFKSLSNSPLRAERMGQPDWFPTGPGVDFKPVEDAPPPDKTAPQRLSQMRSILRSFSAAIIDPQSGRQELRPLSQPVFRYSQPDRGIVDGALFVFVRATNPELLIMLEAQVVNDKPRWSYSPARFTGRECELRFQDRPVWSHGVLRQPKDPAEPYFQLLEFIPEG
ncbi:MAG: hypothetical protein HY000_42505 [Planctomycetes bacterium]|nr:hypothetical protein [Planctomycetota bacterium]